MPDRRRIVGRSPADRAASVTRSPRQRSSVTNGALFIDGDEKGAWARRFGDLCAGHASDLGGADELSEAQLSLIRRTATLEVQLERLEAAMSKGEDVDLDVYGRATGHLRRILETLGIKRVARDIVDPLDLHFSRPPCAS